MLAKLHTFALVGIDAVPVEVEVDAVPAAQPKTVLVGLPERCGRAFTGSSGHSPTWGTPGRPGGP